jgi:hypothetical protein
VYGEQLMDVLSSHQLRPAHLNLIYNRLAQMGAEVEQTPEQSCEGMERQQLARFCRRLHQAATGQQHIVLSTIVGHVSHICFVCTSTQRPTCVTAKSLFMPCGACCCVCLCSHLCS